MQIAGNRGTTRNGLFALPVDQLAFVDQAQLDVRGGKAGLGYIYATSNVDPSNWFFRCHFHEDPVMPGSLGLETISQAIQAYALQANLGTDLGQPHFENAGGQTMIWKYRGQVLGDIGQVDVEVHITGVTRDADGVTVTADASLWKRDLRIYEFKNVAVRVGDAQ